MPQYLLVPATDGDITLHNTTETNPYKLYKELTGLWGTPVYTSFRHLSVIVAEEGDLYNLPRNPRASVFYRFPPGLCGDAIVVYVPQDNMQDFPSEEYIDRIKAVLKS